MKLADYLKQAARPALGAWICISQSTNVYAALEEVVVTAQKREESLQKTPLAITAITADRIQERGITDVSDLSGIAPNLVITTLPASTTNVSVAIRGIVNQEPILTADSPVAIYVDGVVLGRSTGAVFDMVDLERIEVLRGPQGTLYGRNTTGGAINLISAKPSDTPGGKVQLTAGNFGYKMAKASLETGEISNSGLAAKFTALKKLRDGYIDARGESDDDDPGAYDVDAYRLALSWVPSDSLSIDYGYDYSERKSRPIPFQMVKARPDIVNFFAGSTEFGGNPLVPSQGKQERLDTDAGVLTDDIEGHSLTLNYDLSENMSVKSLTGYREWRNTETSGSLDGHANLKGFVISPAILAPPNSFIPLGIQEIDLFKADNEREQEQFSQEFNLVGSLSDNLDYVLGAYYFKETSSERSPQSVTIFIPLPQSVEIGPATYNSAAVPITTPFSYNHESESKAIFAQADYSVSDKLSTSIGIRYTRDTKELEQQSPIARNITAKFSETNWVLGLKYELNENHMAYARVGTGYKAGGMNARAVNEGYDPETLASFEIGLKSMAMNGNLKTNVALFRANYEDLQTNQFLGGTSGARTITVNAGKAVYQGIEAELELMLSGGFGVNASAGYVDRDFDEFIVRDPNTNELIDVADEARFTYSSALTTRVSPYWEGEITDLGTLRVSLDYNYRSRVNWHPLDRFSPFNKDIAQSEGYELIDARISLSSISVGDHEGTVALWGKNLTDEDYRTTGIDFGALGFAGASYGIGRSYGLDFILEF